MRFHDCTILITGALQSHLLQDTAKIDSTGVKVFSDLIVADSFRKQVHAEFPITLQWEKKDSGAMASFYTDKGVLLSSLVITTAASPDLLQEFSVAWGLATQRPALSIEIADRPLLVTIFQPGGIKRDVALAQEMGPMLAAAFFTQGAVSKS